MALWILTHFDHMFLVIPMTSFRCDLQYVPFCFWYHVNYAHPLVEPSTMQRRANGFLLVDLLLGSNPLTMMKGFHLETETISCVCTGLFKYFNGTTIHKPLTTFSWTSFLQAIHPFSSQLGWLANSPDESPNHKRCLCLEYHMPVIQALPSFYLPVFSTWHSV